MLKIKPILYLIFLLPTIFLSQTNPFKALKYDKVVAYEYQGNGDLLIKDCLKNEKEKISKSVELSKDEINQIELAITSKTSYGNRTMSCFDPHFAMIYYKKDKIIATVEICLQCNSIRSTLEIPSTKLTYTQITDDYSALNEGFSKQARKDIHVFCEQLGFTKYLKPLNSFYDD